MTQNPKVNAEYIAAYMGPEQEQAEIVRSPYQPKTATADLMVMHPL
ncbi:hypothetical protein [Rhizobium sp. SYY.PMSO]